MKTISAGTYLPILQALILDGKTVCLNISGSSMAPFLIHQRDSVRLQRPEHPPISGDIVLYQRENGQFILHRICRIKNGFYYLAGDNQTVLEGPESGRIRGQNASMLLIWTVRTPVLP